MNKETGEKNFDNLTRFLTEGAVAPVRIYYQPGGKPERYSAHDYYPPLNGRTVEQWVNRLQRVYDHGIYEMTYEKIGKKNGNIKKQAVSESIKRVVREMHRNSDAETKRLHPLENISFDVQTSEQARIRRLFPMSNA